MQRRLVQFDGTRFMELDKVALARTAQALLQYLPSASDIDASYGVDSVLMPLLEKSIKGLVEKPVLETHQVIGARYFYERSEGTLPEAFTAEFSTALSRFLVRAMAWPLDPPEIEVNDGRTMAWVEFEQPGDWPNNVKHP